MYTAVASSEAGSVRIIRPELHRNRTQTAKLGNLLRTDDDRKWLNSASIIRSAYHTALVLLCPPPAWVAR